MYSFTSNQAKLSVSFLSYSTLVSSPYSPTQLAQFIAKILSAPNLSPS